MDDRASWVNVTAYDAGGHVVGSTGNIAIGASYVWVAGGFSQVSRLSITRDSGWYVMDDLSTSVAAPVPEPSMPLISEGERRPSSPSSRRIRSF